MNLLWAWFNAWRRRAREHKLEETIDREHAIEELNETYFTTKSRWILGIPDPEDRPKD